MKDENNIGLRLTSTTESNVTVYIEQRPSGAPRDVVVFFVFAGPTNLTGRMTTRPSGTGATDTDGDGLADGTEVRVYGSSPVLKDTDADGLADNIEVAPRTITIPVNGTAKTITFTTSPTSDDTDADGVKDPDELAGILDHRILFYDMETTLADGRMRDWSGNGGSGTVSGTSPVAGKVGNARSFASPNYVQVADAPVLSAGMVTVGAWVNVTSGAGTYNPVVAKGQSGVDFQYYMDVRKVGSKWKLNAQVKNAAGTAASVTSSGSITAAKWTHVAFTFDGSTVRLYLNGAVDPTTASLSGSIRTTAYALRIGAYLGSNLYFTGSIDEVQMWDRALSADEIDQYAAADLPVVRLDMESLRSDGKFADFAGRGNAGTVFATSIVEGRIGFARSFAPAASSVDVTDSASLNLNTAGLAVAAYVLATSAPAFDVSLVAKKGEFYLNLSSDGRIRFTVYTGTPLAPTLPLPMNRWVRVSASSDSTTMALYVDDALVASAAGAKPADTSNPLTLGRAEGCPGSCPRFLGALDEVVVYAKGLAQPALARSSARGILLNPNATDTDYDGLADGQELFVRSVKTPKRYPIPDASMTSTDRLAWDLGAPPWAVVRADAMVGVTHPDMGQVSSDLVIMVDGHFDRVFALKAAGTNTGQANNFTSYDLFQTGLVREDFAVAKEQLLMRGYDNAAGKAGQVEYLQLQVTVHTLPNRADTDSDALNDSEELNLGSDGFATNPWKADTDADGIGDALEYAGWSRPGSTIISNPTGFHTDPTRADTDYDGTPDGVDRWPLLDAYVEVYVSSFALVTQSFDSGTFYADPYVPLTDAGGNETVSLAYAQTPCVSLQSGSWVYCSGTIDHAYTIDLLDDAASATFTVEMRQDRSRYNAGGDINAPITPSGGTVVTQSWTVRDDLSVSNAACNGYGYCVYQSQVLVTVGGVDYRNQLRVEVTVHGGTRSGLNLILPDDYAGIYNVTSGGNVYRRYVGEPRFVRVLVNTASQGYLIPRSLFFDTELFQDLQDPLKLAQPPYADASSGQPQLTIYENGTTAENSDILQYILAFDGLSPTEQQAVLDALLRNATGVVNKTVLAWSDADWSTLSSPYLLGLPDEAIQIIPYAAWFTSPSHPEYLDDSNPPLPFWVRLILLDPDALNEAVAWIHSGLVWIWNGLVAIGEAIVNFGSWVSDLTSGDPERVDRAVKAAQKAWDGFVNWIVEGAVSLLRSSMPTLDSITLLSALGLPPIPTDGSQMTLDAVGAFINAIFSGWFFSAFIALGLVLETVATWLSLQSFGAAIVLKGILGPKVVETIISVLLRKVITGLAISLALLFGIEAVLYLVLPQSDSFWREGLGMSVFSFAISAYKLVQARLTGDFDPTKVHLELMGFALTVLGLIMAFATASILGAWIGLVLAGIGLLITWANNDLFDLSPVSPLNAVEEITGISAVGYAVATLAREYAT